jgi:ATP-binding cassette subfamily B protein/subfamily B ATP-binding cassette protein MsbA
MGPFARVMRLALNRRWTLVACLGSSLVVAVLWGLNISAVFPMVEVIFDGQGAGPYVQARAEETRRLATDAAAQVEALRSQIADAKDETTLAHLQFDLESKQREAYAYERSADVLEWLTPHALRHLPNTPFRTLLMVVVFLCVATVVKLIALTINLMLVQDISQRIGMQVRESFFRRALRQDMEHYGDVGSSSLTSRLTGDVNDITLGVSIVIGRLTREPLKMLVCLVGAGMICWRLLVFTFIVAPLVGLIINSLSRSIRRSSRRVMEEMTQLYGMLSESFAGIRIVRAYNMEAAQRLRFRRGASQYYRRSMKVAFYNAASRFASESLGTTIMCFGLLAGGYLVLNQQTQLLGIHMSDTPLGKGQMILFFGLLIGASDPARKLSDVWSNLQRGIAGAERLMEVIDAPIRVTEPRFPKVVNRPHGVITLDQVRFQYPSGPEVLRGIDLTIPHGQKLAIVGPNGSGKSTIVSLLCRFDDPTSGNVCLDGVRLQDMRSRDLRRRIGLVTQRTVMFDDTILNNIRFGTPRATRQQAIEAAQKAHADGFIRNKTPDGYDSVLGSAGVRLSGGQMQRIALARAFLRDPDIMVLDEATSQIDIESEQLIHQALAEFLVGRTAIMITHRPSTLELADCVAILENGQVTDHGDPREIQARSDFYQSLCGTQGLRAA